MTSGKDRRRYLIQAIAAALGLASATGMPVAMADSGKQPTVVELFTSQGCSSCPPANANLIKLSDRPDVLALSFGVTYWDRLGWPDTFAKPEFTDRQVTYEPALGQPGPFTPQIVVNGNADVVGNRLSEIETLIARSTRRDGPSIALDRGRVAIGAQAPGAGEADVWLVHYDPRLVSVDIRRGENGGRTLPQKNIVTELTRIGRWNGEAVSFAIPPTPSDLKTAILVQAPRGGPILAASTE